MEGGDGTRSESMAARVSVRTSEKACVTKREAARENETEKEGEAGCSREGLAAGEARGSEGGRHCRRRRRRRRRRY